MSAIREPVLELPGLTQSLESTLMQGTLPLQFQSETESGAMAVTAPILLALSDTQNTCQAASQTHQWWSPGTWRSTS